MQETSSSVCKKQSISLVNSHAVFTRQNWMRQVSHKHCGSWPVMSLNDPRSTAHFTATTLFEFKIRAVANQFYRIAQEAVTNSVKHAAANQIDIRLAANGHDICLTVIDDGVGFSEKAQSNGIGLRLMRHGAALSGASFDIRRNGKSGTIVTCWATNGPSQTTS